MSSTHNTITDILKCCKHQWKKEKETTHYWYKAKDKNFETNLKKLTITKKLKFERNEPLFIRNHGTEKTAVMRTKPAKTCFFSPLYRIWFNLDLNPPSPLFTFAFASLLIFPSHTSLSLSIDSSYSIKPALTFCWNFLNTFTTTYLYLKKINYYRVK